MQKIRNFLSSLLFFLVLILALLIAANALFQKMQGKTVPLTLGWGAAVVLTGSMEPSIPINSLVIIHQNENVRAGDIVTYRSAKTNLPVTHRIVSIQDNIITTKGDANNATDAPITTEYIIGKVCVILTPTTILCFAISFASVIAICGFIASKKERK